MSHYYCSECFVQRPFVGPFEGDIFRGWGPITLGLVPLAKALASHLVFKPVCIECGREVVFAAQHHLDNAQILARREEQDRRDQVTQALTRKLDVSRMGPPFADFQAQFTQPTPKASPVSDRRATWSGNGGNLVRIVDRNDTLVAKVPTSFSYLGPAFMLAEGERLVLFQPSIGSSHDKVSIFTRTGFCIIPWRLDKWGAIAVVQSSDGFGIGIGTHLCEPLVPDRSIIFGGTKGFGVIDVQTIGASYFHRSGAREFYDRVSKSRTGEHVIVRATQWDDDDVPSSVIKVFRSRDAHACFSVAIAGNDAPLHADNGELIAVRQPGAVSVYALHSGDLLATIKQPEPCLQLEFSSTATTLLRVDDVVYALR